MFKSYWHNPLKTLHRNAANVYKSPLMLGLSAMGPITDRKLIKDPATRGKAIGRNVASLAALAAIPNMPFLPQMYLFGKMEHAGARIGRHFNRPINPASQGAGSIAEKMMGG